jgi:alpha-L-rhamnosidase
MLSKREKFLEAVPVWAEGRSLEMNLSLVFSVKAEFKPGKKYELALTASSVYMAFIDGRFLSMGPARCGHGFYRVDRLEPDPFGNAEGGNGPVYKEIEIVVAGYNVNSFAYLDMPAFLCAELTEDGSVIAATAPESRACCCASGGSKTAPFSARVYVERIQKIQRYSFQRAFSEAYDLRRGAKDAGNVKLAVAEAGVFLERGVPAADHSIERPVSVLCRGRAERRTIKPEERIVNRYICDPRDTFKCYPLSELEACTAWEAQGITTEPVSVDQVPFGPAVIGGGEFAVIDMGAEYTGMIGLEIDAEAEAEIYVMESELLTGGMPDGVDFHRLGDVDLVKWTVPAGAHSLLSFEPYSFRYAKIVVFGGAVDVREFYVRRYSFKKIEKAAPERLSPKLKRIYDAAVETFRQNAVDIYMDCPSRERAGWLCDSYFTSRTEKCLTGESLVERNFLENFLLPDRFDFLPEGMLPMCYPSDHNDHMFIPSWAMFYVLELKEYFDRTGDAELVAFARPKVYGLIDYFERFINEFGLLEKLESWVFVEWSRANQLVQDVNFPQNFVYSRMLIDAGKLYSDNGLIARGEQMLRTAAAMSFTGRFFCDNAYRRGDRLVLSGECTECCQYYAFYFGAADEQTHPELFDIMVNEFGPDRQARGAYPEVAPANAFIGNYLRLDWLMRTGRKDKVLDNIEGYFYSMAERTGTLWELMQDVASCNHGFASHVAVWLCEND